MHAPSHYTCFMIRNRLKKEGIPLSKQYIWELTKPGKVLESEMHEGQKLIPAWRVFAFIDSRNSKDRNLETE